MLNLLTGPAAFVFVLGVTIFWHELGHFITAKAFGMRVFVFSFGFGHRLFGFKWGDTDCRVSLIPLGGYVKLEGEPDDKLSEDTSQIGDGRDFTSRPRWQRILVYLAGPMMNVLLTLTVLTGIYTYGARVFDLTNTPIIGVIEAGSAAEQAGLQPNDEILALAGERTETWEKVLTVVLMRPGQHVPMRFLRAGQEQESRIAIRDVDGRGDIGAMPLVRITAVVPDGPADRGGVKPADVVLRIDGSPILKFEEVRQAVGQAGTLALTFQISRSGQILDLRVTPQGGLVGIEGGGLKVYKKYRPGRAFREAYALTAHMTSQTFSLLAQVLTARISARNALHGPVGLYRITEDTARYGDFSDLLMLVAQISVSVGILNLFPLPPLDGGHLAILYVESAIRRNLSLRAKARLIETGAVLVLLLIASVIYFDVSKTAWFKSLF